MFLSTWGTKRPGSALWKKESYSWSCPTLQHVQNHRLVTITMEILEKGKEDWASTNYAGIITEVLCGFSHAGCWHAAGRLRNIQDDRQGNRQALLASEMCWRRKEPLHIAIANCRFSICGLCQSIKASSRTSIGPQCPRWPATWSGQMALGNAVCPLLVPIWNSTQVLSELRFAPFLHVSWSWLEPSGSVKSLTFWADFWVLLFDCQFSNDCRQCLCVEPSDRPTAMELFESQSCTTVLDSCDNFQKSNSRTSSFRMPWTAKQIPRKCSWNTAWSSCSLISPQSRQL